MTSFEEIKEQIKDEAPRVVDFPVVVGTVVRVNEYTKHQKPGEKETDEKAMYLDIVDLNDDNMDVHIFGKHGFINGLGETIKDNDVVVFENIRGRINPNKNDKSTMLFFGGKMIGCFIHSYFIAKGKPKSKCGCKIDSKILNNVNKHFEKIKAKAEDK